MSDSVIKINPAKATDLDFEVSVQTSCADDKPCVRFSIELVEEKQWLSLVCTKDEETKKWSVGIPALKPIQDRSEYPFVLEVILEDYYFVPAKGTLQPVQTPTVDMSSQTKPTITASFGASEESSEDVKDSEEEKEEQEEDAKEKIEERAPGAGTKYGQEPPTNNLMKPEFPPKTVHKPAPEREDRDIEDVMQAKVTPGEQGMTADTRKEPDGKKKFNAREIAAQIVKDRVKIGKPVGRGRLFNRVDDKAVIEGLEPADVKKKLNEKAEKVKKILKD